MREMIVKRIVCIRHGHDFFPLVELSFANQINVSFWKPIGFLFKEYGYTTHFIKKPFVRIYQFNHVCNTFKGNPQNKGKTPWWMENLYTKISLPAFWQLAKDAFCMAPSHEDLDHLRIGIKCRDGKTGITCNYAHIPFEDVVQDPERYTFSFDIGKKSAEHIFPSFFTIEVEKDTYISMEDIQEEPVTFHDHLAIRFKSEDDALDYCEKHIEFLGEHSYSIKEIKKSTII